VSCLDIGGRLIRLEDSKISYVYPKIKELAGQNGIALKAGDTADAGILRRVCGLMADMLAQLLYLQPETVELSGLFTNGVVNYPQTLPIDAVTFSGGVAGLIYGQDTDDPFKYGDIGVLLAEAIKESAWFHSLEVYRPAETIRATVIGAGAHTTKLSGSTICYDPEILPIKNLPVIRMRDQSEYTGAALKEYQKMNVDGMVAVAMGGNDIETFQDIQKAAEMLLEETRFLRSKAYAMVILVEKDFAKAIGNAIRTKCKKAGEK
jgi:ethanolamine utilization protein EutA